jgi:cytochrome b561
MLANWHRARPVAQATVDVERRVESTCIGVKGAALHGWLGGAILWTAGLHAAAALNHHFILRGDVPRSMRPERLGNCI